MISGLFFNSQRHLCFMNKINILLITFLLMPGCNGTPTIQKTVVPTHPFQNLKEKGKITTLHKQKSVHAPM